MTEHASHEQLAAASGGTGSPGSATLRGPPVATPKRSAPVWFGMAAALLLVGGGAGVFAMRGQSPHESTAPIAMPAAAGSASDTEELAPKAGAANDAPGSEEAAGDGESDDAATASAADTSAAEASAVPSAEAAAPPATTIHHSSPVVAKAPPQSPAPGHHARKARVAKKVPKSAPPPPPPPPSKFEIVVPGR
jgi:hypothetical protein